MSIEGVADTVAGLGAENAAWGNAVAAALYQEGHALLAASVRQTPVDTGRLRQSGYVSPPVATSGTPMVEVGFGVGHALPVHELTEVHHRVGKAKFLEDPLRERADGFAGRIARRAKANYEAGIGVEAVPAGVAQSAAEAASNAGAPRPSRRGRRGGRDERGRFVGGGR